MNRLLIKKLLHWAEVGLYLLVPVAASIIALSLSIFPATIEVTLQLLLGIVAALAISESLGRFGTLNDIAIQTKHLSELSNLELLRSADEAGIVSLSARSDPKRIQDICREIDRAKGIIELCGVALPGLVQDDTIRASISNYSKKNEVWVLLLNPDCDEARRRAKIEKAGGTRTIADIQMTMTWLKEQMIENKRFKIHLYSLPPMLSLIITDQFAFVEPYHFGRPEGLEGCIGGHVPMMKIRNRTELGAKNQYEFFKSHFEYLWTETKGLRVNLSIVVVTAKSSSFVVLENQMSNDIKMAGWKLSAQDSSTSFTFPSDCTWKQKTKLGIFCGPEQPEDVEKALHAEEGFMGNNSLLTLINSTGMVVAQLAITQSEE